MTLKTSYIIDSNLISGSSEGLRSLFSSGIIISGSSGFYAGTQRPAELKNVEFHRNDIRVTSSDSSLLPSYGYNVRLTAYQESFINDDFWRYFLIGGEYADTTYSSNFDEVVYSSHLTDAELPYTSRDAVRLPTTFNSSLTVSSEYYNYLKRYQNYIATVRSPSQIANFYFLSDSLLERTSTETGRYAFFKNVDLEDYLNIEFVNSASAAIVEHNHILSADPTDILSEYKNRTINTNDISNKKIDSDLESFKANMPFGTKINIDATHTDSNQSYRSVISSSNGQVDFVRHLKETFMGENNVQVAENNFVILNIASSGSDGISYVEDKASVSTVNVRLVDYIDMLSQMSLNPIAKSTDFLIIESSSYQELVKQASDPTGFYSLLQSARNDQILENTKTLIDGNYNSKILQFEEASEFFTNFYNKTNSDAYKEVIAYRVEKIGGTPTGDNRQDSALQNFWFFNKSNVIEYFDSQVKYNQDYTYNIYAYMLIEGLSYQTKDLRTTRKLAEENFDNLDGSGILGTKYCLEFYDPYTNDTKEQLFSLNNRLTGSKSAIEAERDSIIDNDIPALQALISGSLTTMKKAFSGTATSPPNPKVTLTGMKYPNGSAPSSAAAPTIYSTYYFMLTGRPYSPSTPLAGNQLFNFAEEPIYYQAAAELIDFHFNSSTSGSVPRPMIMREVYELEGLDYYREFLNNSLWQVDRDAQEAGDSEGVEQIADLFLSFIYTDLTTVYIPEMQARFENIQELNNLYVSASLLDAEARAQNSLATNAQVFSFERYMADFTLDIEPSIKLVEVPLEQKLITIIDNPPNTALVQPTFVKDASNKLVFNLKHDVFSYNNINYPASITAQDEERRDDYFRSKDYIDISTLKEATVSPAESVEIFRTNERPTSYSDFFGKSLALKQMRDGADSTIYNEQVFYISVKENTKYYFAFRFINSNGVAGPLSKIYESELINDGGYRYANFSIVDLDEKVDDQRPSLDFKKLVTLILNRYQFFCLKYRLYLLFCFCIQREYQLGLQTIYDYAQLLPPRPNLQTLY